jgi:kinesin family protein 6/9
MSDTIKIFSRIRPKRNSGHYTDNRVHLDHAKPVDSQPQLHFNIPRDISSGWINNQKERFDFKFEHVFDEDCKQEEVFDVVAKDVIQR